MEIASLSDNRPIQTIAASEPASLSILNKGLGPFDHALEGTDFGQLNWNLLREDLSLPTAVLYENRLSHNLRWMQQFINAYGLQLAPHGKTTMAPKLFERQLQAGAWGITLATAHQTLVAYHHGVRRVLMANQLIGKANMAVIAGLLQDPAFSYFCLVDSAAAIDQLGAFFSQRGLRLNVLLEIGVTGGRSGIRNEEPLQSVLSALTRWRDCIILSGVELFEGVLNDEPAIRAFLQCTVEVAEKLAAAKRFQRSPIVLSGAGSAWYDIVAEIFSGAQLGSAFEIVLRPGCYLTHDVGAYREAQAQILERNPIAHQMRSGLLPALQIWAYVQSMPEPNLAIIGMGKRDASFDSGLPVPALHFRPGEPAPNAAPSHWSLTRMMDQHAFMRISDDENLHVGDMIGFDICHPCLTFDKWRVLPVLNADYQVIDLIQTFF